MVRASIKAAQDKHLSWHTLRMQVTRYVLEEYQVVANAGKMEAKKFRHSKSKTYFLL
jgi:hypothetical protein